MGLPDFSVRRPVTIMMVYVAIMLIGLISWKLLPQEFYPPITFPQLTIKTIYKDAAPEEIELLITKPIEEVVGTVSGLRRVSSISKEEVSIIIAEFNWGTKMDFAALHVREKIDLIKERLPRGAEDPVVLKFNPFEKPVLVLNITGDRRPSELLEICKKQIKAELEKVEGVAAAVLRGGQEREILIEVDQGRLGASGIPIVKISEALSKSNVNFPAGTIEEEFYEFLVRAIGEFKVVEDMEDVVVETGEREIAPAMRERLDVEPSREEARRREKETERRLIYLRDLADVKDTLKERHSYSRYNIKDTITLSIQKQAGTHTLTVAKNIKKQLVRLKKDLPGDINIDIVFDGSSLISSAISGVRDAAVLGGILAVIILYLFLRNLKSALIVATTIPISILATFSMMYFSNLTLNMISLGGLALGVGMLVDNGIVTVENIFRHRQLGRKPKEAAIVGTQEVTSAIVASTLTTIMVFLPMVFVVGIVRQILGELAFTIAFSLLASLFVALTLVPILSMRERQRDIMKAEQPTGGIFAQYEDKLRRWNAKFLKQFLANRRMGLLIILGIFIFSAVLLSGVKKELLPKVDQGQFSLKLSMRPGTKLEVTNRVANQIEKILLSTPETKSVTMSVGSEKEDVSAEVIETLGSNQAEALVSLKPKAPFLRFGKKYRRRKTSVVLQEVKKKIEGQDLEGGEVEYSTPESELQLAFGTSAPIAIEIKGRDLDVLKVLAGDVKKAISSVRGVYSVRDSIILPSPETKVFVLKDKAASFNLSVSDIALTAQTGIKGYIATKFKQEGKEIDVRVRLREEDRRNLEKVKRLIVHSPLGIDISLADVAVLTVGKGPTEIRRLSQQRCVIVSANIFKRTLSEVMKDIEKKLAGLKIPSDYRVALSGEYEQMKQSFDSLAFALVIAILFVYMIMAAQFESLWQPFIIMFTFPLSIIGVALALLITNTPLSVMVILGMIILGGIVVNNGIVLIDFANQLRAKGASAYDAIVEASNTRLRPILMTALTTIFGLLPLALGISEGTEIQVPMAIAVMGGLTVSAFLTLNVIPAIYLSAEDLMLKIRHKPILQTPKEYIKELPPITQEPIEPQQSALNPRQASALDYLRASKRITRKDYSKEFDCSIATAARDLKDLQDKGLIIGKGPLGIGRYYKLKD
ncbi:MAG: efflux RND transporter permease subunit [Candidatus Omnitrophota bacterium]